jgi:hypothetical protein
MSDDAMSLEQERPARRWRLPFTWLGLLAICFIVYELTHQPALGAVAVCLKFGWEDFLTARWLSRTDPVRRRGRACSWLFFAWGLWKTGLVAFLMSIAFAAVTPKQRPPGAADPLIAFLGTFLTTLVCFGLSTFATNCAVLLAWRGRQRLWLDRAVHRARRAKCWPPSLFCEGRRNRLGQVLVTSLGLSSIVGLLVLLTFAFRWLGQPPFFALGPALLLAPMLIVVLRELINERVRAEDPFQCWAAEEFPADFAWPQGEPDEPP